jgi:energy-coupling factor transporter ATP-binding protein EcfA2
MKKATTIKEIYSIFAHEKFLKADDKDFYVDLYGTDFKKFVVALKNNEVSSKAFFIAGQSGNGKSTVLNLLTTNYPELEDNFEFNYIAGRTIFLYEDIDIVDILIMIGNTLTKNHPTLQEKFFEKLQKLEDIKVGVLEESYTNSDKSEENLGIKAHIGVGAKFLSILKASVDLESSYKINEEIRNDARRFFKIKRKELIDLINEIISEYKYLKNDGKDLVIVIDDLEKKDNIDNLFLKDISLLNELNLIKIITMPIHIHRNETFPSSDVREFGLKLKTYDNKPTKDLELLKEVILKRLENKDLITDDAINLAIEYSGANLRQLIKIIHIAAEEALTFESDTITDKEVQEAINRLQKDYSSKAMNMKTFLNEILKDKFYEDSSTNLTNIARATKMELVFAYFNGIVWYEVNPIIKNILSKYTKQ